MSFLVTGAGGHLGRRVLELLLERGVGPLVATTRTPERLADLAARGVTVRAADFDVPSTLAAAFAGATRVLLVSTDALDRPGRRLEQHRNAVAAAVRAGVKHVVYTSMVRPEPASPITIGADHRGTEEALLASGLGFTVLRNNLYAELLLGALPRAVATGQLVAAAADGRTAYVTREDCAQAAAAALAADFDGKRTLDVTGPDALSQADLAAIAAELTGRAVTYAPIPVAALEAGMVAAGLPEPVAALYAGFDAGIAQGYLQGVGNGVPLLTGRPAESARSFLARHRAVLAA